MQKRKEENMKDIKDVKFMEKLIIERLQKMSFMPRHLLQDLLDERNEEFKKLFSQAIINLVDRGRIRPGLSWELVLQKETPKS